jgi:MoaA/NifB/PqqE/SkfB family radical SAM enzyme
MPWKTLSAAIDLLRSSSRPEVTLAFYGGEPLLELALLRRAVEFASASRLGQPTVRFHLTTNGTLLDADAAAFLATHRVATRLSFDGVQAAQDRRAPGTFARLDALLSALRSAHPGYFRDQLEVAVTLTAAALPWLGESVEYLIERQVRSIRVAPLWTDDPDWDDACLEELDRQFALLHRASLAHYERTGQVPLQLLRRDVGERRPAGGGGPCSAATGEVLTVDVDGEASGCVLFAGSYRAPHLESLRKELGRLRIGLVTEPGFPRRLAAYPAAASGSGLFEPRAARRSSYGCCDECPVRAECVLCPVSLGAAGREEAARVPDLACAFNRVAARYRALFPPQPSLADVIRGRASPLPLPETSP